MTNLNNISQELLARLPVLASRWRAGVCDAAEFAALYFLHWQIAIHGQAFASRKRKHDPRPDAAEWLAVLAMAEGERLRPLLLDWLERYQFRGVIGNVPVVLVQWLRGAWPLILREDIPSPRDILRWQASGTRAVTVITAWPRAREPVLNKSDAFAFSARSGACVQVLPLGPVWQAGFSRGGDRFDRGVFAPYFTTPNLSPGFITS
jgi:hypothetical protein